MPKKYTYGQHPDLVHVDFEPVWHEYMHYLYLPVMMPGSSEIRLPKRLEFIRPVVETVRSRELLRELTNDLYVYVTARRGFASPGNPLNRPGWHADGFGSDDINYIWSDRWPTRFAVGDFRDISDDHVISAQQFEEQIDAWSRPDYGIQVYDADPNTVYRLDPSVVHATPIIEKPGGDRSFFKISVSPNQYNLKGNSHNHLFDYNWTMWDRDSIRNDPAFAGGDIGPQE